MGVAATRTKLAFSVALEIEAGSSGLVMTSGFILVSFEPARSAGVAFGANNGTRGS